MTEVEQVHPDFKKWERLLENLNVWDDPDDLDEATTRRSIEVEIIEEAFGDDSSLEVGRDVDESDIDPTNFQSTERVEIERIDDDILGKTYQLSAKLADLNPDPRNRLTLHFEGHISEKNGLETKHPVVIRRG